MVRPTAIKYVRSLGGVDAGGLPLPLLSRGSAGTEDNRNGFEGGRLVKVGTRFYIFTAELYGDIWAQTRLAWWRSEEGGESWEKEQTGAESDQIRYPVSALVNDAHPDGQIVFYEIDPHSDEENRQLYLWGDSGLVQRVG